MHALAIIPSLLGVFTAHLTLAVIAETDKAHGGRDGFDWVILTLGIIGTLILFSPAAYIVLALLQRLPQIPL